MSDRPNRRLPEDASGIDEPHDILAAEEFAVPMRSPGDIPHDPIHEPHDVLAAEEFAMPTGGVSGGDGAGGLDPRTLVPAIALVALALAFLLRRRR
jgi:MYXO-CTERM domain-containing protein